MVFKLWALHGEESINLGVIPTDADGYSVFRTDSTGESATLDAFVVSLEPRGGSATPSAPSGVVVMMGALER